MQTLGSLMHVAQETDSDCGLACLAMLTGIPLPTIHQAFQLADLEFKHGSKTRGTGQYSANGKDLQTVAKHLGLTLESCKFSGWGELLAPSIIRTNKIGRNWHWVVAEPHSVYGTIVLDPALDLPGLCANPPLDLMHYKLELWQPYGPMLQITDKC